MEMEYVGGPYTSRYRWTVTMPANWPADAYQVTVVAYGGYGELFSEYAVAASDVRREHAFAENESLRGMGGGLKIISYYTYYNNYYYIEGIDLDNDPAGEKYAHQLGSYNSTQAVAESTIANALEPAGDIWLRWIPQTLQEPGGVSHPHFAFHFPAGVKYYQVTGIAYEDIDYLFCSAINWDEISVRAYYPESGTLSGTLPPNNPDPNEVPLVFIIKTNEDRYAKLKLHEAVWWEEQQGWLNQCLDPSCAVYTTGPLKFPNAQYTLDFVTY